MGRIVTFVIGVVVGGVAMFGSLKYHVVRAEDGVHLVAKTTSSLDEIYVDVRKFGPADWTEHKDLTVALVKADKQHLIGDTTADSFRQSVNSALEGWSAELSGFGGSQP
jgi:hypothetical protein